MQKLLITTALLASLSLTGCGHVDKLPFVYRIDVQQGNVVTQEAINQLEPGMNQREVRYIMGTPLIDDTFQPEERWDYLYWRKPGGKQLESYRVTLYFEDERLSRIVGDKRPEPDTAAQAPARQSTTVVVPPQQRKPRGILAQLWQWVTFSDDDELQ